jgi:LPXTG-motif cell wall-anchored protein
VKELKDARRPIAFYNPNWGIGIAGLFIGGALFMSRRKRESDRV